MQFQNISYRHLKVVEVGVNLIPNFLKVRFSKIYVKVEFYTEMVA